MTALLLRTATLLAVLFTLAVGTMHAQPPYEANDLRASLFAAECTPPCFLGIRPGVTTEGEAIEMLRASAWVASVYPLLDNHGVAWTWSGQQPAFLQGGYGENSLLIWDGIVTRIDLMTGHSLATFLLTFGQPDEWESSAWSIRAGLSNGLYDNFVQTAAYDTYPMKVTARGRCPLSLQARWALRAQISLFARREGRTDDRPPVPISLLGRCR